jgi:hypothetical protein
VVSEVVVDLVGVEVDLTITEEMDIAMEESQDVLIASMVVSRRMASEAWAVEIRADLMIRS